MTEPRKIIIRVWDEISDLDALARVREAMKEGRISDNGKCYCYATTWNSGFAVHAATTKTGTDVFQVCKTNP